MTRGEAISAIQSNRPTSGYTMLCEALDMAVSALLEQEERRWIPATERLPEADVAVLARCYYRESWRTLVCHKSERNAGEWYTNVAGQWVQVTHWIPLPEPPKGD